jgi:hypothetical protein
MSIGWDVGLSTWRLMRKVIPIRGSLEEHGEWKRAAQLDGFAFSAWARRVLNEAAEAERERREAVALSLRPLGRR